MAARACQLQTGHNEEDWDDDDDEDEEEPGRPNALHPKRRQSQRTVSRTTTWWSQHGMPQPTSLRRVNTLGVGELGEEVGLGKRPMARRLQCPEGHLMTARIVREMRNFLRCGCYRCCPLKCDECDERIDARTEAYYKCKECHPSFIYCADCARRALELPTERYECDGDYREPLDLMPGDVLLCGPTTFGIHHVVLARSGMEPAPWMHEWLQPEPGLEIYQLETIESTQAQKGDDTWWYPATCFVQRDPYTGDAALMGDMPPNSDTVFCVDDPVPMKVLLHPLRPGVGGGRLDADLFAEVVEELSDDSKRYGKTTAIRAWIQNQAACQRRSSAFPPAGAFASRSGDESSPFLERLEASWDSKPICATVAIKVWQKYFKDVCDDPNEAAELILKYMPCWCDATTPSKMTSILTRCDWQLRLKFDSMEQ